MSATITWKVNALECYPRLNDKASVVFTVHWESNASETVDDKTYTARIYSTQSVQYKEEEPYTEFDQLTEEQVLGWIWTQGVDKESTEAALLSQIEGQKNPQTVSPPLPWNLS